MRGRWIGGGGVVVFMGIRKGGMEGLRGVRI